MINIFHMGSCRTTLQCFNDSTFSFVKNFDFSHTTKEVLMYLDFFDGLRDPRKFPYINCLMYFPENFDPTVHKRAMDQADFVFIELSSLKLFEFDGHFYSMKMVQKNDMLERISEYKQSQADFIADIQEIRRRIDKPIIFTGHLDLDFYDIAGVAGHIEERSYIDQAIEAHCDSRIILKELFGALDYKAVMKENDTHHLTDTSKQFILRALKEECGRAQSALQVAL